MSPKCNHERLQVDVSSHAVDAGFVRPPLAKRAAATTSSGRVPDRSVLTAHTHSETLFPGPLVLPDDGLAIDPKEPPQSFRSWMTEKLRNPVTRRRKTIYVAPTPTIDKELHPTVGRWTVPFVLQAPLKGGCSPPSAEQVREYLEAFYHPLPVKILPHEVRFVQWSEGKATKSSKQPQYIGLRVGNSVTRITARPCPDKVYPQQLSLNDILDAAIEVLPDDAYALVVLTDHDLYEDEDDDFCCGRAYGSSRVAVVSSSRYHPLLDEVTGIEREHMWPFSHCEAYVQRMCRDAEPAGSNPKRRKTGPPRDPRATETDSPMASVIQAGLAAPSPTNSPTGLWFSRMARTVAHEVGHCFCLAHCSYYACVMQGTAGIIEDMRQPPYLCLVCLAKLTRAIGDVEKGVDEAQLLTARYTVLAKFCEKWKRVAMFAAYGAWLGKRIESLKATVPSTE